MSKIWNRWPLWAPVIVYLTAIFPFCYFRHDDWLILGNALFHLKQRWEFAFSPTLFYATREIIWFFRPGFKAIVLLFYELFGVWYYGWVLGSLVMTGFAFVWGMKTVRLLTSHTVAPLLFLSVIAVSFHLHFGSIAWMGEGMMNCPQIFFVALNIYLFCRGVLEDRRPLRVGAALAYILALSFKESSLAQPAFLFVLIVAEPAFRSLSWKDKFHRLFPYAVLSVLYVSLRFGLMPVTQSYYDNVNDWKSLAKQVVFLLGAPSLVFSLLGLVLWRAKHRGVALSQFPYGRAIFYLGYLLATIAPYFGHGFFSPGWLLKPGFDTLLLTCLVVSPWLEKVGERAVREAALSMAMVASVAVGGTLVYLDWWHWHIGQKQMESIVKNAPKEGITRVGIMSCVDKATRSAYFSRVIGFSEGLFFLWKMHHPKEAHFNVYGCELPERKLAWYLREPSALLYRYDFPHFVDLKAKDRLALTALPE